VDDNAENRYLMETILRSRGYEVVSAENGIEALQKLKQFRADLIVSDILMPQMDGFQFCREVKEQPELRGIPFIFYTATYTDPKDEELCLSLGAARFMIKPVEPEELLAAVDKVFEEHKTGKTNTPAQAPEEEQVYLKTYNSRLIGKLERKVAQLEAVSRDLQAAIEEKERELAERRRVEEAIRKSEARLRLAQQAGRIGSWEVDILTNELHWSDETYRIFGLTPDTIALSRETFVNLIHPADRDRVRNAIQESARTGKSYCIDHRILRPDGSECIVSEHADLFLNEEGKPVRLIGTVQDVTDRRRLEEQLRHSQKMEAIGQLAAGVAHDFNNILTVIQGNALLQLETVGVTEECAARARQVVEAAERASSLTRQLLLFSRNQVMQPDHLDLNEVVGSMTKMLQRILGEDLALHSIYAPNLPSILGDAGMIEQVVLNLAVNSRDAMQAGGQLHISTSLVVVGKHDRQQNPDSSPGPHVCLSVRDTGCGITPEHLLHIYEPFFTTKEVGKGTGLGLATVYGIVKQHRGWIDVDSKVNAGTTFRIYLPAVEGARAKTRTTPSQSQLPGGQETILVVEDEAALRLLVSNVLQRCGYTVLLAESGVAALEVWKSRKDRVQLLLTDMIMPDGMTGRELADTLRAENPQLKVIYTSGYSPDAVARGLTLVEGVTFLQKPYPPLRLAQTIRNCLDQK
jgi:hypothetical protein